MCYTSFDRDMTEIRTRYPNLYIPQDFVRALSSWLKTFPFERKINVQCPCPFVIEDWPFADSDISTSAGATFSGLAPVKYNARVMLLSGITPKDAEQGMDDKKDRDLTHLGLQLKFLCGRRGSNLQALGGSWSAEKDGGDPAVDQSVLVQTAIRTVKEQSSLDLSQCATWRKFFEIRYSRPSETIKDKETPRHEEVTVVFIPDVWNIVPTMEQTLEKFHDVVAKRKAEEETRRKVKEEKERLRKEKDKEEKEKKTKESESEDASADKEKEKEKDDKDGTKSETGAEDSSKTKELEEAKKKLLADVEQIEGKKDGSDSKKDGDSKTADKDSKKESRERDKEKESKSKESSAPEKPSVIALCDRSRNAKFDLKVISLDGLLDYSLDDVSEKTFEVSLFAEQFNEMLQRDSAHQILQALLRVPDQSSTSSSSTTPSSVVKRKREEDHQSMDEDHKKTKSSSKDKSKDSSASKGSEENTQVVVMEEKSNAADTSAEPISSETADGVAATGDGMEAEKTEATTEAVDEEGKGEDGQDQDTTGEESAPSAMETDTAAPETPKDATNGEAKAVGETENSSSQGAKDEKPKEEEESGGGGDGKITIKSEEKDASSKSDAEAKAVSSKSEEKTKSSSDKKDRKSKDDDRDDEDEKKVKKHFKTLHRDLFFAFRYLDKNDAGYVIGTDLEQAISNLGMGLSRRFCHEIVSKVESRGRIEYRKLTDVEVDDKGTLLSKDPIDMSKDISAVLPPSFIEQPNKTDAAVAQSSSAATSTAANESAAWLNLSNLETRVRAAEESRVAAEVRTKELALKLKDVEKDLKRVEGARDEANASKDKLTAELAEEKSKLVASEERCVALRSSIAAIKQAFSGVATAVTTAQGVIDSAVSSAAHVLSVVVPATASASVPTKSPLPAPNKSPVPLKPEPAASS